jgi:YDG domain
VGARREHRTARRLVSIVATFGLLSAMLVVSAGIAFAGGNSTNAKLCQKGGWQTLVREDGTTFRSEAACISYGAKGGTLYRPVTATVTAADKVYDGTNAATITLCSLTGVVSPDAVTCSAANATFASTGPGPGISVTASGITLDANAGRYLLTSTTATTTASITPPAGATGCHESVFGDFKVTGAINTAFNGDFYYSVDGTCTIGVVVQGTLVNAPSPGGAEAICLEILGPASAGAVTAGLDFAGDDWFCLG